MPINDLIILRKGLEAEWINSNPVLASGEPGYETDTFKLKIGDGTSVYNNLPFAFSGVYLQNIIDDNSPALSNNLNINNNDIIGTGNIDLSGNITANSGNFSSLFVNNTGVALSEHTHTSSQITDFGSRVSGLLPANIVNGSGIGSYTAKWSDSDTLTTGILYDNGNNIGIGTSSPLAKLHIINQNTFQNPNVIIYDSASLASGVGASIILGGKFNTAGSYGDFAEIKSIKESDTNNNASASLAFFTTNVADLNERMRITSGGNLGVGTNNPTSRLQVEGGNFVFNDAGGDFDFRVEGDTVQNLLFTDASADSVGIGTNAPAAPLHLVGSKHANFGSFLIQDSTNFAQNVGGSIVLGGKYNSTGEYARFGQVSALKANSTDGNTQGVLSFSTNDGSAFAERMRILPSGNVAFGSTGSDVHRFSIRGNINQNEAIGIFSDTAYGSAATSGNVFNVYSKGQVSAYTLQNYYHFFSTLPTLSNGAVINNELCFTATNNTTANVVSQRGFYSTINGSNSWQLFMDGTAPSFIRGNVGIGTSAPTHLLHVEGGNVVFNDAGGNFDFRVEGDSDANLFFTDASTDRVGIGTNSPSYKLDVVGSGNFSQNLLVNGTAVSVDGHTHTSSNITDFSTSVSGLLPVKNIVAGSNVTISSTSGIFTINSTGGGGGTTTETIHPFLLGGM